MKTSYKVNATVASAILAISYTAYAGHTNTLLKADLKGKYQVATTEANKGKKNLGDKNGSGTARVFGIDGDPTTLCYVLEVDKIQLVPVKEGMLAHIHKGQEGVNGPVVANLAGPEDGNAADCLTEGEKGKFPTGELVKNILANPANYYINIHNPKYPNGALRGQLEYQLVEDDDDHTHDK